MGELCLEKCTLNINRITLNSLKNENKSTTLKTFDIYRKGIPYRLEYSPVGNYIKEPNVIICGKTPGRMTWEKFLEIYRETGSLNNASYKSIYSNMKDNLFNYLSSINFFSYMEKTGKYWTGSNKKELWDRIFSDEVSSKECGIQLTQACNCAILCGNSSKEPTLKVFNNINNTYPDCFFNKFRISDKLKLIIFLDTPSNDSRFHQIKYWEKSSVRMKNSLKDVQVLSITHPSSENNDIYRNLDSLDKDSDKIRIRNAARLKMEAQNAIARLT